MECLSLIDKLTLISNKNGVIYCTLFVMFFSADVTAISDTMKRYPGGEGSYFVIEK